MVLITLLSIPGAAAYGQAADATQSSSAERWTPRREVAGFDKSNPGVIQPLPMKQLTAYAPQTVEGDIEAVGSTTDYIAFVLDWNGSNNLFIKVQQQAVAGKFDRIGFYRGNNAGGWPGMTGGTQILILPAGHQFTTAHMSVSHDGAGNVRLDLTNLDGGGASLSYTRGGWTPLGGVGVGYGAFSGNSTLDNWQGFYSGNPICDLVGDDFNRADGPLGGDWIVHNGNPFILGNLAQGSSTAMTTFVGGCAAGIQSVEADVGVVGLNDGTCALMLNHDVVDGLYIKVQQQDITGQFEWVGFYHGDNDGTWLGMTGGSAFFNIPVADRFSSAHMKVILDASGTVRLLFSNRNTGGGVLEFQRGGWSVRNAHGAGIGGWTGDNIIDDFAVYGMSVCDAFDRPNGAAGPSWETYTGSLQIAGQTARPAIGAGLDSLSLFIGACAGSCPSDITGDGVVNVPDLLQLLSDWGSTCP